MTGYARVDGSVGLRRSFVISCGLQPGYDQEGEPFDMSGAAVVVIGVWQRHQLTTGRPLLTGATVPTTLHYGWRMGDGSVKTIDEPGFEFRGEISPLYARAVTDSDVEAMLDDLAGYLAANLGQTRVYVTYRERTWVLQAEDRLTPTQTGASR